MKKTFKKLLGATISLIIFICFVVTLPEMAKADTGVVHSGDDEGADVSPDVEWHEEIDDSEIYYADDLDYEIRVASFEYVEEPHNYHIYYPQIVYKNKRNVSKANKEIRDRACLIMDKMYPKFTYEEKYDNGRNESTVTYEITYMDNDYISIAFYNDYFIGSVYAEYHDAYSCTIDLNTQERVRFYDVFDGSHDIAQVVYGNITDENERLATAPEFNEEITDTLVKEGLADGRYNLGLLFMNGKIGATFTFHYGDGNLIYRGASVLRLDYSECADYILDKSKWTDKIKQDIKDGEKAAEENEKKEYLKNKKKKPIGFMF